MSDVPFDLESPGPRSPSHRPRRAIFLSTAFLVALSACDDGASPRVGGGGEGAGELLNELQCSLPEQEFFDGGVGVGGIPSLENPEFVSANDPAARYLDETQQFDDPRVVGVLVDGEPYAIPHNILWWHEIVNLDFPNGLQISVTYCPLTGSALVFDREAIDGAELGVSGLLFQNNLIMFDRRDNRSLWPQMMRQARCGVEDGRTLDMYPAVNLQWSAWESMYPGTLVVGQNTNIPRDYTRYPYGSYKDNRDLLFPQDNLDERRPMKEWVLGIPAQNGQGGIAFPFRELQTAGPGSLLVVESPSPVGDVVVFWDERAQGAMAFFPEADGQPLTLFQRNEYFMDEETGSTWNLSGQAVDGPMEGASLEPVPEAYPAFWFAWAAFHPDTDLWSNDGG